ncbi:General secretion pathway protein D [Candidatus Burkholderia verschuerenii]|uniref:General secretion pathway protein D n=1 Tax=Candidatus Burkholderia verschuerenii TaxID=242163 RepID=A0A0L0MFJ4_9BURK|nr:General secretion pathway protein D [Candidatus Burkholderia verschuerenii]
MRRIAGIIAGVDTAAGREVDILQLKNANAIDVTEQMNKLLDPGTIGSTDATLKVTVTPDARTNSLMFRASSSARLAAAKQLAMKLDAPTSQPGNMHVVALRNADATRLAKTLRGMLGKGGGNDNMSSNSGSNSQNSFGNSGGGLGNSSMGTGTSGTPPLPSGFGSNSSSSSSSNPMSGGGGTRDQSFSNNNNNDNNSSDQGGGMIQADSATNSLIITAPDPVYRNLRTVIDQLDARRAQVYIEALIVELSATTAANLGIQWQGALLSNGGNNALYGSTSFGSGNSNIVDLTLTGNMISSTGTTGLSSPILPNGLSLGLLHKFGNFFGLGGLLQALSSSSDANILSTPNLITLDNEEAKIVVGQNVPVVTGSYATPTANTATSVTAFNTFDRRDVGVTLHVKPQITESGVLKLQLYQEDSTVDNTTTNNPGGVTINTRSIQSTVLADDGEIVVLGGLMQDQYNNGNSKIPLLGDIPWIGNLFRSENKQRTKTNLMVFLRPVIVRDQATASQIANTRYDYLRQQQYGSSTDNRLIRDKDVPMMPPKPLGSSEGGGPPAQNLFDWNNTTRGQSSSTLPQNPQAGPAPQPVQTPQQAPTPELYNNNGNGANSYAIPNNQPNVQPSPAPTNNGTTGAQP